MLKNEEKVQEWEDLKESFEWENRAVIIKLVMNCTSLIPES